MTPFPALSRCCRVDRGRLVREFTQHDQFIPVNHGLVAANPLAKQPELRIAFVRGKCLVVFTWTIFRVGMLAEAIAISQEGQFPLRAVVCLYGDVIESPWSRHEAFEMLLQESELLCCMVKDRTSCFELVERRGADDIRQWLTSHADYESFRCYDIGKSLLLSKRLDEPAPPPPVIVAPLQSVAPQQPRQTTSYAKAAGRRVSSGEPEDVGVEGEERVCLREWTRYNSDGSGPLMEASTNHALDALPEHGRFLATIEELDVLMVQRELAALDEDVSV